MVLWVFQYIVDVLICIFMIGMYFRRKLNITGAQEIVSNANKLAKQAFLQQNLKTEALICGCTHSFAFHELGKESEPDHCHFEVLIDSRTLIHCPCSCVRYTGPRQIDPGYIARELS
jgi:hypothetical protein